jgi:hypothetical protein
MQRTRTRTCACICLRTADECTDNDGYGRRRRREAGRPGRRGVALIHSSVQIRLGDRDSLRAESLHGFCRQGCWCILVHFYLPHTKPDAGAFQACKCVIHPWSAAYSSADDCAASSKPLRHASCQNIEEEKPHVTREQRRTEFSEKKELSLRWKSRRLPRFARESLAAVDRCKALGDSITRDHY